MFPAKLIILFMALMSMVCAALPRFYSDPMQIMVDRPAPVQDYRYQRIKAVIPEQKWKRRRATPLRISPFFYVDNPEDTMVYISETERK